ncbi:MAG: hypothetical protein ACLFWB_04615 [Armatimonadota bacterium]
MAPADEAPVNIGSEKQLFVDDYLVDEVRDLRLSVHQWEKHLANPVIIADRPWESDDTVLVYGGALYDEDEGVFKIWYWSYNDDDETMLYAVSDDGITWEKPELDVYRFEDMRTNVVMASEPGGRNMETYGAMQCPWDPDPGGLYKTCFWEARPDGRRGVWTATSPDGIHWTKSEAPICDEAGDTVGFYYDDLAERYVCFVKLHTDRGRSRAQLESENFEDWTEPRLIMKTDDRDDHPCQLYNNSGFIWGSMRLGFVQTYYLHEHPYQSRLELELMYSRDGQKWQRMPNREPVLQVGDDGSWDRTNQSQMSGAPIVVGDRMYTYYGGRTYYHPPYEGGDRSCSIGLATMRLDGFVSRDASPMGGYLTIRPLIFEGDRLHVNVKSDYGHCRVEVLDEDFEPVEGYSADDADDVCADSVDRVVTWKGNSEIGGATNQPVRLRFHLQNARLYAFWIDG